MAINFYTASPGDGFFNIAGKAFHALNTLNTARLTTVPTEVRDILTQFATIAAPTDDQRQAIEGLTAELDQWKPSGNSFAARVAARMQSLLIAYVEADNPQEDLRLETQLTEFIAQMITQVASVDASTVSVTVTPDGSNAGDTVIVATTVRGDGRTNEHLIPEDIRADVTSDSELAPGVTFRGEIAESNYLSENWPQGSACNRQVSGTDASTNLLANSDFEDEDDATNVPDDWIVSIGTPGTTVKVTNPEVQTLVVSGTPTAGHYLWQWQNPDGIVLTTAPIAYNASSSTLQTAIRLLKGLELVDIVESGTTPNFTHTITFTGVAGNLAQHTVINNTTSGVFTPATTTQGDDGAYKGKALEFDSDGAELTTIQQRKAGLEPKVNYIWQMRVKRVGAAASGLITVDLVDGIGGTVINDDQGTANSVEIDAATMSTSTHDSESGVFRLPRVVPPNVYFRIRISSAIPNTASVYFDELKLRKAVSLYDGGPEVGVFTGRTPAKKGDFWTLAVANDRAGALQEWFERAFRMTRMGLILPSNAAGAETIPDSVIA